MAPRDSHNRIVIWPVQSRCSFKHIEISLIINHRVAGTRQGRVSQSQSLFIQRLFNVAFGTTNRTPGYQTSGISDSFSDLSLSLSLKTLNCYWTTGLLPLWRFASSISLRVITSLSGLIVFFQCPRIVKGQDEGFSIVRDARFTFIASILCCNVRRLIRT